MPELKCTVQTCVHNEQFLCMLDEIQVGGSQARDAEETCCDSFQERKGDSYSNSYGNAYGESSRMASDRSGVDCKARECMYNNSCKCEAGKISVEGGSASQKEETECATFQYRG